MSRISFGARLLSAFLALVAFIVLAPAAAFAGGTPNLSLTIDAQDTVLYGKESSVSVTTTNPPGTMGRNLSYRLVLPANVAYVAGSAGAVAGEPVAIANQPAVNQTTLLWRNVADIAPSSSHTLGFRVQHAAMAFLVGSTYSIGATAYAGTDERYPPRFTAAGQADATGPNPYTGFTTTATDSTRITALEVEKSVDSAPDGEILRGVHANQQIYTLTVRNNALAPTTHLVVDDYLPAGLEFIGGCGAVGTDHTTNAPTNPGSAQEYPGAGAIPVAPVPGCVAPNVVETLSVDPFGAATAPGLGIYTHVRWSALGTIAAGATITLKYRAAVPLRANTLTWSGTLPATDGAQAANLDNNAGAELTSGTAVGNWARAQGDFNDNNFTTADGSLTRTVRDLAVRKTAAAPTTLRQGDVNAWSITVTASEYRSAQSVVVTDTVPDGLCPLSASTNHTQVPQSPADLAECATGPDPSHPYTSATEQANGTYAVVWDGGSVPAFAELAPKASQTLTYSTRARSHYQEAFADASPLVARDTATNAVSAAATARVICAGGVACPPGAPTGDEIANPGALSSAVTDGSSASITADSAVLDKKVASTSTDCAAATYTNGAVAPAYRPGDRICWLLRVDYPAGVDTAGTELSDFLPPSLTFDTTFGTSGDEATTDDTVGAATLDASTAIPGPGGRVKWTLPGSTVPGARVFEHRIATRAGLPAGSALGDVTRNLFKTSMQTTGGAAVPLRDEAPYRLSMPVMTTEKRVVALAGTPVGGSAGVATQVVRGGQVVTYRVRLTNAGDQTAERAEVWDRLPAGVTCADVASSGLPISDGGTCQADIVTWGSSPAIGPDVPALSNKDLTYSVTVPTTIEPTQGLVNSAGIRQFQTPTNTGGTFFYVPASNIDPTQNLSANIVSSTSSATITGALPTITKARDTAITESDGGIDHNSSATATIGETIHYTVSATVPAGITVRDFAVTDLIDPRQQFVGGSLTQTAGPAATVGIVGTQITLSAGSTYTAPVGADTVFRLEFDTTVKDATNNYRTTTDVTNTSQVLYTPPGTASGGTRTSTSSNVVSTQLVEPSITVDKTADVGTTPVVGNQLVEYTVSVANGTGAVSPAHDTTLVDLVPSDVTPLNTGGNPIADGESTTSGGVWNAAARTITFSPSARIWPGAREDFVYRVRVNDPAIGGKNLTNTVTATTSSIAGTVSGERTIASPRTLGYTATKSNTLTVLTPSVTKTVADASITIGQRTTYTVDVTIPANTINYDAIVKDTLPDSLDFDAFLSQACIAGCDPGPTTPAIQPYAPVTNAGLGTVTLAWDLGDLTTQAPVARTFRLVYGVHLRATHRLGGTNVVRPQTSINSVRVMANRTDKVGAFNTAVIPAGTYDDTSAPATRTVTAIEPGFLIDKQIGVGAGSFGAGPVLIRDGDTLKYRVTVTNSGNAPAYDVEVTDTPNAEITGIATAAGDSTDWVTDAWVNPGDDLKWTIPTIPVGGTATVTYTAALPPVTAIKDGDNFDNTAQVTKGYGLPQATRLADAFIYRSYTSATDLTRATFDSPTITVDKTTGAGAGPGYPDSANAQVGQAFTWRVRVTNSSGSETATSLSVRDVLPRNWTFVPGSASFAPGGAVAPAVVANAAGDELTWSTPISLAPGGTTVLSYQARPTVSAVTSPGTGPGNPHVNSASATVRNGVGNPADENGIFAGAPNTAEAVLLVPNLSVSQTPDAAPHLAGVTVPFSITVTNGGAVAASNVVVSDTFPARLSYVPGSATASVPAVFSETSGTAGAATWRLASIPAGSAVTITVPLVTDPATPAGTTVTNTASVLADQTPSALTDNGSVVLSPSANLAAAKSSPVSAATAGQALAYTVAATNNGPSVADTVVLTDSLPGTVNFVSASSGCAYVPRPTHRVTCTFGGATAVGATRSATINTMVVPGTTTNADNTVTASSSTPDPATADNTAAVAVSVGARADLSLVKRGSTTRVAQGQTMTFDLEFANAGPSDAAAAELVDTLPAGLTYVSGPAGCSAAGQTVTCAVGTIPTGGTGTRQLVVRGTTVGVQTNSAAISSATTDPATANNTATAAVTVAPSTDLSLTKTGPPTVDAGGQLTYELRAHNDGPDPATGVAIVDSLPVGLTYVSGDAGCGASGQTVTCPIGNLASGATATRHVVVRAEISAGDQALTNNASVRGAEVDPVPANDVASASTQVGPAADLSVSQSAPPTSAPGGNTTFTIVAHNGGPSTATGVTVTSELPDDVVIQSVSSAQGSCSVSGKKVTCVLGSLLDGASVDITITVKVPEGADGRSLTNLASVVSDQPDPDGSNAAAGTTVQVVAPPAPPAQPGPPAEPQPGPSPKVPKAQLSLTKTTNQVARAGERLNYLITATNNGPDPAENVVVTDALAGDVVYRSAKSSGVKCDHAKGTISCPVGKLAVGDSVRINVAVTPNKAGILVNNAVLSASTTDPDMSDNRAVALGTVPTQKPTKLSITKKASAKRVRGGQRLTYTLTVRNTGKEPAVGVDVCDQLPGQLAFTSTRGGELKDARLCFHERLLAPGAKKVYTVRTRVLARARRGAFSNKATAVADNAARVAAAARSTVTTDGKVSSAQVRGFTG